MMTLDREESQNPTNTNAISVVSESKNSIDPCVTMSIEALQQMMTATAQQAATASAQQTIMNLMQFCGSGNQIFDNSIGLTDVSKGNFDMAKRLKQRVTINGKDQWITGETHQDLFDAYLRKAQEEGLVMQKTSKKKDVPTMREFIEKVYKPTYIDNLGAKTVDNYMQYINLNILPFMGDMRLDEINVTTIQQFYDWMANASSHGRKKNLNRRSIERISGFLGRIFKVALDMKIIDDHPIKKTLLRINAEAAGHHKALSDDEIARVKEQIPSLKSEPQRLYMALLGFTGMRPEEVLGLMWEDVHLNCKKPHALIMRAVTYPGNSKAHIGLPKTPESARTVILPEKVVKILSEAKKDHGFICGSEKPWCYSTKERHSKTAFKTLGIEDYTDYDFRTTFGTQLKESGVSSAIIADLMGHADTRMVETVYARARHEGILKQYDAIEKIS